MNEQKKPFGIFIVQILLFAVLLLWHDTGFLPFAIKSARPLLPFSLLIAFSMFSGELPSALCGLVIGIFFDSTSSLPFGFNGILFFLLAFGTALITHYLFNNNIRSALALCFMTALIYFVLRSVLFYSAGISFNAKLIYLLQTALPSALYTAVFIIPFYYLERRLLK